jgi:hypothetical protein
MTNEKTFIAFLLIFGTLSIIYTALKMGQLPRSGMGKHRISTPGQWHSKHTIVQRKKVPPARLRKDASDRQDASLVCVHASTYISLVGVISDCGVWMG